MNREQRREIEDMRFRSGRMTRNYMDHLSGITPGMYRLFRCFLAAVFFVAGITFPMISDQQIPEQLTQIPEYISENYTLEDVSSFLKHLSN